MVTIRNEKIEMEEALKNKIEFICGFCGTTPTIYNGNIKMIYLMKSIIYLVKKNLSPKK